MRYQKMTTEQIRMLDALDRRAANCDKCGVDGIHVDTQFGDIIIGGVIITTVHASTRLMVSRDLRARLLCAVCADN